MRPHLLDGVALGAAVLVGATLVVVGWYGWPSTDDFCNRALIGHLGVLGAVQWLYEQWSGRVVTSLALYATVGVLDLPELRWVSVVFAAGLVAAAWQIARFVVDPWPRLRVPVFGFVTSLLAFALYHHLAQVVYWPTGAIVYGLPLLLWLFWLRGTRNAVRAEGASSSLAAFGLSFLVGNSIELLVPLALAYLAGLALPSWRTMLPNARRALIVRAAGVLLGFALLASAPGNIVRAQATPGSFPTDPVAALAALGRFFAETLAAAPDMVAVDVALLLLGVAARLGAATGTRTGEVDPRGPEAVALAAGAIASLLPVLAAPAQFAPRNSLYLLIALFLAGLLSCVPLLARPARPRAALGAFAALTVATSLGALARLGPDVPVARAHRAEHLARDRTLREPERRGRDVLVAPIVSPAPRTMHAIDIGEDPRELVNWCVADYYGLHSVALEPGRGR